MGAQLERLFKLSARGTNVRTEVAAGLTTFMVMAYIIFVNPNILSVAGVPQQGALVATCLVAGLMTLLMGFWTNYPFALAPGMGINSALVALVLANSAIGLTWQEAMGVIFLEGVFITLLVLTGLREAVMNAIPMSLKRSISVGIGLFILFIGLFNGGFIQSGVFAIENGIALGPLTELGTYNHYPILVAAFGLLLTLMLIARKVKGGLLWGILATTAFAIILRYLTGQPVSAVPGAAEIPPLSAIFVGPSFETLGAGLNFGVFARLGVIAAVLTIFAFMLSDFFDTMGTVIGIGSTAGWVDNRGRMGNLREVLVVDSLAAVVGGAAGASSATTYIESAAGVEEGGRTGLTSVVVGILFLLAIFLSPLAGVVPQEATAAALIIVGFLMAQQIREIPLTDFEEGVPALFTMLMMPFSWSITNGIAFGFISYVLLKLAAGKARQVSPLMWLAALAFLVYLVLPWLQTVI